jgi:FdrA protein
VCPVFGVSRRLEVRPGAYRDSVSLMRVSRRIGEEPGVRSALVAMATDLNLEILAGMGFPAPERATPNDMVVAIEAADDDALGAAATVLDEILAERISGGAGPAVDAEPRTIRSAAEGGATLALISTPGQFAAADAFEALDAGLDVMLFSDNVPVGQEIALKRAAAEQGRLVMGPDCGTAVIAGVGLGFANVVRVGSVGLVAASGTGAQQLMCLLDAAGLGISHCLGVGGRDLSSAVGGRSTLAALDLLAADSMTEQIVVVSKPPAADVVARLRARIGDLDVPVELALLGPGQPTLTETAERLVRGAGLSWSPPRSWPALHARQPRQGAVRGLFSGGTLADEARFVLGERLGPIRSNTSADATLGLPDDLTADGHFLIDFGDDRLTRGRPHPMIDNTLRVARIVAEGTDPACAVIVLDVVLGHGAHPDPAADLAPAITQARTIAAAAGRELAVVVSLTGAAADPQGLDRQALALQAAGASVHLSNAEAARTAADLIDTRPWT